MHTTNRLFGLSPAHTMETKKTAVDVTSITAMAISALFVLIVKNYPTKTKHK